MLIYRNRQDKKRLRRALRLGSHNLLGASLYCAPVQHNLRVGHDSNDNSNNENDNNDNDNDNSHNNRRRQLKTVTI